ncbi:MAG: hypothetical protein QM699_18815 [Amaricoccus sp.]|uniref:hypothetical protein n=1 Tax=Amaricoccus sp. TaxID=1872485 RepID=UPI0039E50A21
MLAVFPAASTTPALIETGDGTRAVLKFSGAGPGPAGLLTELLALPIAAALGAPVPAARPLWLPPGLPWEVGTDEFDAMLLRSTGWNLGVALLPDARPAGPADIAAADPATLDAIARADALLANMDRTATNPNLLVSGGSLYAVDYDACLYLTRALAGRSRSATLPPGHLLAGRPLPPAPLPVIDATSLATLPPDDWLAAAATTRPKLAAALAAWLAR